MNVIRKASLGVAMLGLLLLAAPRPAAARDEVHRNTDQAAQRVDGGLLLGAKVGGLVSFGGLSPNAKVGLEVGYVAPWLNRSFAFALDVDFAAPKTSSTQGGDGRVTGGAYGWHLTEQELAIMPVVLYRVTSLGRLTPFGGIGPRVYMLRSTVRGDVGSAPIEETTEQSTKVGFGVPLGVEFQLGPGGLLAELLLEYGKLDHSATGSSNTAAVNLSVGYRFLL